MGKWVYLRHIKPEEGLSIFDQNRRLKKTKWKKITSFFEIPYMVNKARTLEKIAELVKEKKIDSISEIRDESDKDGMRIVIDVKKGESVEVLENNLFSQTQLEQSFGINFTVLVNGQPKVLNLKEILAEFIKHRKDVVTKRTKI